MVFASPASSGGPRLGGNWKGGSEGTTTHQLKHLKRISSSSTPIFDATRPIYDKGLTQGRQDEDTAAVFAVMGGKGKTKT